MSYDIFIGNAKPAHSKEDGDLRASWEVEHVQHDDAPSFPDDTVTGKGNSRHPAYSAWGEFCRTCGLYDLFFDEAEGLMREHPGCFMLRPHHVDRVTTTLKEWRKKHPISVPAFNPALWDLEKGVEKIQNADPVLARLIWLDYWMRWAIKNCETPAIQNY